MTPLGRSLLDAIRPRRDAMLDGLKALVEHESPSLNKSALDGLSRLVGERFRAIGGEVTFVANTIGGEHVVAVFGAERLGKPALVLGHFDTVWPMGTLATMPFRIDGELAFGPGVYDMKASLILVEEAVNAMGMVGREPSRPIIVLFTSDEEIGSVRSRSLIEEIAIMSEHVLVLEPPLGDGALKTARKGVGGFKVRIEGRAAHAGIEPEKGISAIVEAAHQILAIGELENPSAGTTLNVGIVAGGSTSNVVAAEAKLEVDARVITLAESARVESGMRALASMVPGTKIEVNGGFHRPPMERTAGVAALFAKAREIGAGLDLDLREGSTGGASDGNFTAALGIPTLDGLGCPGAGAHALNEQIQLAGLTERAALLAALLLEL